MVKAGATTLTVLQKLKKNFKKVVAETYPENKIWRLIDREKKSFDYEVKAFGFNLVCLLVKYVMNNWTEFNETLRNESLKVISVSEVNSIQDGWYN